MAEKALKGEMSGWIEETPITDWPRVDASIGEPEERRELEKIVSLSERPYLSGGRGRGGAGIHSFCVQSSHREYNNLQVFHKENKPR